jgi:hypothetical protein
VRGEGARPRRRELLAAAREAAGGRGLAQARDGLAVDLVAVLDERQGGARLGLGGGRVSGEAPEARRLARGDGLHGVQGLVERGEAVNSVQRAKRSQGDGIATLDTGFRALGTAALGGLAKMLDVSPP